jgi:hypothetical protein
VSELDRLSEADAFALAQILEERAELLVEDGPCCHGSAIVASPWRGLLDGGEKSV